MERKQDLSWLRDGRVLTLCGGTLFAGFLLGMLIFGSPWHLPPAWGDIPTWITAVATIGLLIGAIVTARYAIKAFRAQSDQLAEQRELNKEQTRVLRLQARELRNPSPNVNARP
jgi:NADH:ubiquinone oxidoreductase subunit 5 (subunit L)/multisubunit Na+/H+ antiporter MnhA subunit